VSPAPETTTTIRNLTYSFWTKTRSLEIKSKARETQLSIRKYSLKLL
jgi:hypothetical protein